MKYISVAAVAIGLFWIDRFLAKLEQSEVQSEAAGLALTASRLLAAGNAAEAVVDYRRAHALARTNQGYALGYAQALLAAGDVSDAEATLNAQLAENSNDAPSNLAMARVMVARSDAKEADSFYHRAIYGVWSRDAAANQERVRLELAEWLAKRGAKDELLAELLSIQASRDDTAVERQVAELLLAAGSPARAADQYRALIQKNSADLAAHRGLAEAELRLGNYPAAQRALLEVVRRDGTDVDSAKRLQMLSVLVTLDPTPRRIPAAEKFERSKRLLARVQEALSGCGMPSAPATADRLTAEAQLTLAEQLWRAGAAHCPAAQQDEPLKLVMDKLTAQ